MDSQKYTPEIMKIMKSKGGQAFPGVVRLTEIDDRTGKSEVVYSNEDIALYAKSVFQRGTKENDDWKFLEVNCPHCQTKQIARIDGIFKTGWTCKFTRCQNSNIPIVLEPGELLDKTNEIIAEIEKIDKEKEDKRNGRERKDGDVQKEL